MSMPRKNFSFSPPGSKGRGRPFRGQRIKRPNGSRGGSNQSPRGTGSMSTQQRQNWLNIDQVAIVDFRQRTQGRVARGGPSNPGNLIDLQRGVRRIALAQASSASSLVSRTSVMSRESLYYAKQVKSGGSWPQHSPSKSRSVMLKSSLVSSQATSGVVNKSQTTSAALASLATKVTPPDSTSSHRRGWFPPEGGLSANELLNTALEAPKFAEASFGWFVATTSILNPLIPVLPRLAPELKVENESGPPANDEFPNRSSSPSTVVEDLGNNISKTPKDLPLPASPAREEDYYANSYWTAESGFYR